MKKSKLLKIIGIIFLLLIIVAFAYLLAYELGAFGSEAEWSPRWSPDGNYIAFECAYPRPSDFSDSINNPTFYNDIREICVFDLTRGKYKRLTNNHRVSIPTWSPKGDRLAWISSKSIIIWNTKTHSQTEYEATSYFEYGSFPSWSKDGKTIFVERDGTKLDLGTGNIFPLEGNFEEMSTCCFRWSPDGQYLAYQKVKFQDESGPNHWRLIIEKKGEILYESDNDADFDIGLSENMQWSPDANTLAWIDEENHLILMYMPTLQTTTIDNPDMFATEFAWAPSGNKIAIRAGNELHVLDLVFSEIESQFLVKKQNKIIMNARTFGEISWSPDEKNIAYESSYDTDSVIWLVNLDTKKQIQLLEEEP